MLLALRISIYFDFILLFGETSTKIADAIAAFDGLILKSMTQCTSIS